MGESATHRITYVGHATVLIEAGGARILTDPVLRHRIVHLRRRR
ncbi:MAG: MBL fold metallo-hydrolase, partial [Caldilinea sp.]|nr:MBL fold metallo-hydrolase [Caldilinea sp.]